MQIGVRSHRKQQVICMHDRTTRNLCGMHNHETNIVWENNIERKWEDCMTSTHFKGKSIHFWQKKEG